MTRPDYIERDYSAISRIGSVARTDFDRFAQRARTDSAQNWYRIDNRASSTDDATIHLYSDIGYEGDTAAEFVRRLRDIEASELTVRINSMGGLVSDGITIYNALRDHPAHVTTQVDGWAASIASVIVQAGDRRIMYEHSQMLIHEAHGVAINATASDLREIGVLLERQTDLIADIYTSRGTLSRDQYLALMRASGKNMGTLLSDTEAVDNGLADEVKVPAGFQRTTPAVDFSDLFDAADDVVWDGIAAADPSDFDWS